MRDDLERLLDDSTLVLLALAIALGWSLFEVARGVGQFVDGLFTHVPTHDFGVGGPGLTWVVGHHLVTLDALLLGVVELLVVLAVAVVISRRASAR